MKKKLTKNEFLAAFSIVVLMLTAVRLAFPSVRLAAPAATKSQEMATAPEPLRWHRIGSVASYSQAFPDSQSVQIVAAERWGVRPVENRTDAEHRMRELVYVGESPYYHVDPLTSSIPYLVPRAAVLLEDIGQSFFDSLYVKGLPLHQVIVTSVLRSKEDVMKLQQRNGNATDRSCHLYGTTVDICYNRYQALGRSVSNDTLKWVLSEVLRDKRDEGRCYIKYEVKQGCFHLTVR